MLPGQYMFGVPIFDAPLVFSGASPTLLRHPVYASSGIHFVDAVFTGSSSITVHNPTFSSMGHYTLIRSSLPLFISGFSAGNVARKLHLMIRGTPVWTPTNNNISLFTTGVDQGLTSSAMNLNINGGYPAVAGSIPLLIQNNAEAIASALWMFVKGDGLTPGYIPYHSQMNLYIERGPNGGITLYIENREQGNSIPLFISGHPTLSGQSPLYINGLGGTLTRTMNLSIPSVSIPTSINRSVTLSIPNVVGRPTRSVTLYIVGWR